MAFLRHKQGVINRIRRPGQRVIVPGGTRGIGTGDTQILNFAGDTSIQTTVTIDPAVNDYRIEATVTNIDSGNGRYALALHNTVQFFWGKNTSDQTWTRLWSVDAVGDFAIDWPTDGTEVDIAIEWNAGAGASNSADFNGETQPRTKGSDTATGFLVIGRRTTGPTPFWLGTIRDVKVYDSDVGGTLLHHWPIDDGVGDGGEITDIVGGEHGTLTLGTGSWS